MIRYFARFDFVSLVLIILLCGIGGAILASLDLELFTTQAVFYVLGFCLFFLFSQIDYHIYSGLSKHIYAASLFLLLFTLVLGLESRGAVRWLALGNFRLQFSEILKPFFCTTFAAFLISTPKNNFRSLLWLLFLFVLPLVLIFKQPDLGSTIVYFLTFIIMLLLSEVNLLHLFFSALGSLLTLPILWNFLASYQKQRIMSFLSPHYDPLGASYNAIQSVITVGSGLWLGRGLGRGTQSHLLFLPEHHTDFIFASLAEELGFVGAGIILVLYFYLLWRILTLAQKCPDRFGSLIAAGLGSLLLVQAGINIAMNLGLVPVTGIPLPLISYGGSSLLSTLIALGIVENIASQSQI